ncbi:MAG TPA: metal-dependent hydrolase [Vicinamibacterales bacterium]
MDNITHSLFGVTLARTPLGRAGRGTTAALLLASNAPDVDFAATAGGAAKYLEWHRGITHGPLGVIGLSLASAGLVVLARRLNPKWRHEDDASFAMLVAVSMIGVLFHVLMDLPTSYGIRLLSPFSWRWFSLDWMPIVDMYLLIVLASGLWFGRATEAAKRRNAVIVLTFVAIIYGVRAAAHRQALDLAPILFGPTLPPRCDPPGGGEWLDSWPKPAPSLRPDGRRCLVEIAALPGFSSPFDWRIVAQMSNAFELHDINVLDQRYQGVTDAEVDSSHFWRQSIRYPNIWTPVVAQAATTPVGSVFLGFSRFPAARTANDSSGTSTVRFTDVRFVSSAPADSRNPRSQLFTATIRIDGQGRVTSQKLGP